MVRKSHDEFKRRLYRFTLQLVEFLDRLPSDNVSKRIGDQLLRSGTSIIANYIEGYAASSKKEYVLFFQHSLKSANETNYGWLSRKTLNERNRMRLNPCWMKWLNWRTFWHPVS